MKSKIKIWKGLHRNIGSILLLILSFYLVYKIYETQQRIKQRQFRGVFIEGMTPQESKTEMDKAIQEANDELKTLIQEAIDDCIYECPVDKKDCPSKDDCSDDDSECKRDASNCKDNVKTCKKNCALPSKKGKKAKS